MNGFDVLVILFLIVAILRGKSVGVARLVGSAVGFLLGLFVGVKAAAALQPHMQIGGAQSVLLIIFVFAVALIVAGIGEAIGSKVRSGAHTIRLGWLDGILGALFEAVFVLLIIWLVGSALSSANTGSLGVSIRNSTTMRTLNNSLPAPPDILAELAQIARANGFPNVFIGNEPAPKPHINIDDSALQTAAVREAAESVYRIEGIGCGGIVEGTGFAVASDMIATNAHVVAGIAQPYVIINGKITPGTVVLFNKNTDFAILRVPVSDLRPIQLSNVIVDNGTPVAIIGYPSGGPLTITSGAILNTIVAVGRDIYNRGMVSRQIYEVQGDINPGNSGGPMVTADGQATGVVFAKSVTSNGVGYALLASEVAADIRLASGATEPVSTGRCIVN